MKAIEIARKTLLAPAGLTENQLESILGKVLGPAVDSADLYFQAAHHESWALEDGIVKAGSHSIDRGVGVRAISGEKTGFAYSDDILLHALENAAVAARSIAQQGGQGQLQIPKIATGHQLYPVDNPLSSLSEQDK